jgi:peptidoglycan/LPS O-acetylase OafA/YrhL
MSGRLQIVEALRGFAALSVVWFHLTNQYSDNWVRATGALGWLGVEVFFVISGFIIPYSISKLEYAYGLRDFPRFIMRRIFRLEPPYLASIVLALGLWHLSSLAPGFQGGPPPNDIGQIAANMLYLVPLTGHEWLQPVYWTLAWEFSFYLTIGLLFPFIGNPGALARWFLGAMILVTAVLFDLLPAISLLFVLGFSIFRMSQSLSCRESLAEWTIIIVAAAAIALENPLVAFVGLSTAIIIRLLLGLSLPHGVTRILLWLGAISYSLYLTHVPIGGRVVNLGRRVVDGPWQELALSVFALASCILFAVVFRRLIEKPAIALSRRQAEKLSGPTEKSV